MWIVAVSLLVVYMKLINRRVRYSSLEIFLMHGYAVAYQINGLDHQIMVQIILTQRPKILGIHC